MWVARIAIFLLVGVSIGPLIYYRDSLATREAPGLGASNKNGVVFYDRWRLDLSDYYFLIDYWLDETKCELVSPNGARVGTLPGNFCYFFKDGSFMSSRLGLHIFGPAGEKKWSSQDWVHHDLNVDETRKTIFAVVESTQMIDGIKTRRDSVVGFDFVGNRIFDWKVIDHQEEFFKIVGFRYTPRERENDIGLEMSHLNSVQELPPNPVAKIIPAFREGNVLVNCYRTYMVFIIDRETGKIIWHHQFTKDFRAHSPMGPVHSVRLQPDGLIYFFRNHYARRSQEAKFSAIEALNPVTGEIAFSYRTDPKEKFNSRFWGSLQVLDDGRFVVTSSRQSVAFILAKDGKRVLWEWKSDRYDDKGLLRPIYRVTLVDRKAADRVLKVWHNPSE